ncbi:glycoside hydrolase family 97 protein [Mucilaginibacter rubeus]|uniref:glycoside hydrolase family 97 protein n=1 Tax=Mucilaginibacter rubeus TaxID=2027860 RepID=UPI001AD6A70E|nr:glycoside hydrolase family 97 protein [Mucilaginibacter rubeus]
MSTKQKVVALLYSPDNRTRAQFSLDEQGQLYYRLIFNTRLVVNWSRLGIETTGSSLVQGITLKGSTKKEINEKFLWPLGEDASLVNHCNELTLHCTSGRGNYNIIVRVYDGSLAFRYVCKQLGDSIVQLKSELTEFNLAANYRIYQYHEESVFRPVTVDSLPGTSDLPSTLTAAQSYISIGEADNRNYTKCVLVHGSRSNSLALQFYTDTLYRDRRVQSVRKDSLIRFTDSLFTPWRTISCSNTAIGLHVFSQLNLKLVKPLSNEVPDYVKPGKVFRVPINTQGALDGIDFAQKMNFQYILVDAGWYGAEFRTTSDPTRYLPDFHLPDIIAHARQKGIGVILYVNYVGLKAKIDTILPLYKKWGVSGLKFGFVDGGTQKGLAWLDSAMKKVSDYGMVLNVHDHYKPTGLSRRYPYVLSQEGIRGDENSPDAFHNTVLPFTRYLAGPADFTFCYPNRVNDYSKNIRVSKAQQMALTIVYFDPLQAIFWYGRSQDYKDEADIDFFKYVPTVWDESKYVQGEIGDGITVARRKGRTWYLGSAAGLQKWGANFKLDFLEKNQVYTATVYDDDGQGGIQVKKIELRHNDDFVVDLDAKGGQAVIIRPQIK